MVSDRLGITSIPWMFLLAKVIALISDYNSKVTASPAAQVTSIQENKSFSSRRFSPVAMKLSSADVSFA